MTSLCAGTCGVTTSPGLRASWRRRHQAMTPPRSAVQSPSRPPFAASSKGLLARSRRSRNRSTCREQLAAAADAVAHRAPVRSSELERSEPSFALLERQRYRAFTVDVHDVEQHSSRQRRRRPRSSAARALRNRVGPRTSPPRARRRARASTAHRLRERLQFGHASRQVEAVPGRSRSSPRPQYAMQRHPSYLTSYK